MKSSAIVNRGLLLAVMAVGLQACNDSNDASVRTFEITVSNLTTAQPLSPAAVIHHRADYHVYQVGSPASQAVERLAEGGDNGALLAESAADPAVFVRRSGSAAIVPGGNETFTISHTAADPRLTVMAMLVNSNDGFAAVDGIDLSGIANGGQAVYYGRAYDAGTEANSETASTVPGQGGEGFNVARDDRDRIALHAGVVSQDDGLATSSLSVQHRFDNPVIEVRVRRIQ